MQCPLDGAELVMTERAGVEIDYCPKCRGVWLDRGELDKIIEKSAPPPPPVPLAEPGRNSRAAAPDRGDGYEAARDAGRDFGRDLGHDQPRQDRRDDWRRDDGRDRRRDDDDDDHKYRKRKRGGFLEDLFDF